MQLEAITCRWIRGNAVARAVTQPLLAASPGQPHQLRVAAVLGGILQVVAAQRYAGQPSAEAAAQLGAGGLEQLAFLQPPALHLAAQLVLACAQEQVRAQ